MKTSSKKSNGARRVFLIHGWEGKPDNHWFPWLSWELKSRGFDVYALTMPHADAPKVSEWITAIKDAVGRPNPETYFVGHSLGCIATLRYFETLPKTARVGGAVYVAGFCGNLGIPQVEEFYLLPLDMEKAKSHCSKFVTIFSDNDSYVSMERSFEFQKALGAKAVLERGKGHFSKSEGVDALPSVFRSIIDIADAD
ncbi:MAG: alpha/beta fold hydrolase [bacterium]|nr:alpha/beta fold hydrolase [bacterium]